MRRTDGLLRKKAFEKLSATEQLDDLLRVTSPVGWIALTALGVLITAMVLWSIFGKINVRVNGSGILLQGGAVQSVQAPVAGKVEKLLVKQGDIIQLNQPIASLLLVQLDTEIESTTNRITELSDDRQRRIGGILESIDNLNRELRGLEEKKRNKQKLVEGGIGRRQDVVAVEGEINAVKNQVQQAKNQIEDMDLRISLENTKLQQLTKDRATQVGSSYEGRVSAVLIAEGQLIQAGSPLITVAGRGDTGMELVLFVPLSEGKKVEKGDLIRISPTTVKPEEHGYITGTIREGPSEPVTFEEVKRTLGNDRLAQRFADETPFKVSASPDTDSNTASGFRWTSAKGPPVKISSGTPCNAYVIVEQKQPIEYVIPFFRKIFGAA